MNLLAKTNPAATRESVTRHALVFGIITAVVAPLFIYGSPVMRDSWVIVYPLAILAGAALGGLLEWQPLDEIDVFEVVLEAEEEFDIKIPEMELPTIESVGQLYDLILISLRSQHPERFTADADFAEVVWERLKALITFQLGVDAEEVVPSARFHFELS